METADGTSKSFSRVSTGTGGWIHSERIQLKHKILDVICNMSGIGGQIN